MSSQPSPNPRHVVLQAERALASIESDLRRATPTNLHKCLEALADAYLHRPAGHRLDNLDRALLSYQLAVRLSSLTPSLSAKLGNVCFLRLQVVSGDHLVAPSLLRQHLAAARYYVDFAVHAFESDPASHLDSDSAAVYSELLLCRALVYDTLYQTLDTELDEDGFEPDGARIDGSYKKRRLKRNHYISDCIESLEKALAFDASSAETRHSNRVEHERTKEDGAEGVVGPRVALHAVNRARAVMCLARAYSNVEDGNAVGVSKAITLLGSVEEILAGVEDEYNVKGVVVGLEELRQMKEDAQAQLAALAASRKTTESKCVVS